MKNLVAKLLSIPKSLYWNIKWYGIKGFSMPVVIHFSTKINVIGTLIPPLPFSSRSSIGFSGCYGIASQQTQLFLFLKGVFWNLRDILILERGGIKIGK